MPIGIPAALIASSVIGAGASIAGSALSGKPKTSTATSTPNFTPAEQSLVDQLLKYSGDTVSDPSAGLGPLKTASMESINRSYGNLPQIISKYMAQRGYGSSGEFGNSLYQTQLGRLGSLADFQGQFANLVSNRQQNAASLGDRLLSTVTGRTSTSTTPDTSLSNGLLSAGNAFNNIGLLAMMQKMLGGGGGSTPAPGSYSGFGGDYGG